MKTLEFQLSTLHDLDILVHVKRGKRPALVRYADFGAFFFLCIYLSIVDIHTPMIRCTDVVMYA